MTNSVPNRVRILRKSRRLSQKEFAQLFSVDQTAVSNWEQGKNSIDVTIADKIADCFGVPVEYVYGKPFKMTRKQDEWKQDELDDYRNSINEETRELLRFRYGRGVFEGSRTTVSVQNELSDDDIKVALFGGDGEVTEEMWNEVKRFVEFVKQKKDK